MSVGEVIEIGGSVDENYSDYESVASSPESPANYPHLTATVIKTHPPIDPKEGERWERIYDELDKAAANGKQDKIQDPCAKLSGSEWYV